MKKYHVKVKKNYEKNKEKLTLQQWEFAKVEAESVAN